MSQQTYPPLNTLKPVDNEIWIVDGDLIRFGPPGFRFSFPTRMTIIRVGTALFIHSPTELTAGLKAEIDRIGAPTWLIGPNRLHYWWIPDWRAAYPSARVYLAPRIKEQAGPRIDFRADELTENAGYPWASAIATLAVPGSYMTEFVFFHHATRTLVLTDLIENFEPRKLGPFERWLTRIGGVRDPDGKMPLDMRLTFFRRKAQLRSAVETMIAWQPDRIVLAHGRWYTTGGVNELRRAFRWLL
ncbi:MAG TPA: DUF4336 domain-containing protein [Pseudolabrys sp.]|nr:DUF4336 domain-containing protein [Pseudolabrys sp.]